MKYYYDLHIHSALSPCGDMDMTPNNIVNMSILKGLDFIAVTDHNSILNLPAVTECAKNTPLIIIPGMEIETAEEVHMLSLFPTMDDAFNAYEIVRNNYLNVKNKIEIFGHQAIMNSDDIIVDFEKYLLVTATKLTLEKTKELIECNNGVAIPAHIDRNSYSIISNLGSIPEIGFTTVELSKCANVAKYKETGFKIIVNSDAHYLEDIFEPVNKIELEEKSAECLISHLKG